MAQPDPAGATVQRTAFLPSRDGLAFDNSWPSEPAVSWRTPFGRLGIGNAARGLCGGMVYAALDYWHAGRLPPGARPGPGSALFAFIVRRLIGSWQLPAGVLRYYRWQRLSGPDLRQRTVAGQWPQIQAALAAGRPVTLGVVTVASANPLLLGHNHQVVAWACELTGPRVRLSVYDPNSGPDDGVGIEFDARLGSGAEGGFTHNLNLAWPVRGFFVTRYVPAPPPVPGGPA